jgi:cytochrome c oxidase subunit 2|tara:strand:+ start:40 stop:843 length:804 start_codon:yes stop_codon:yes gene_type:complete
MTAFGGVAVASEPKPWQLGFQPAASPTMERITDFHDGLLWVIFVIAAFVLGVMAYACLRFRESKNPTPSRTTHNTLLELVWTAVPVIILVAIAIPSIKLIYSADRIEDADMTLKAIGHQWYWTYEYPDHGNFTFDANMLAVDDLKDKSKRMMETDERIVLPVGKKIRLLITADDVLHNWAVPSFGIKLDAVPGKLNETWVQINKPGVYYGFCSELCGTNHSYMPIAVEAVSEDEFKAWVEKAKKKFARVDEPARDEAVKVARRRAGN